MNARLVRLCVVIALTFALLFIGNVNAPAAQYLKRSAYYFGYQTTEQLGWINSKYTTEAWKAAYTVIGKNYFTNTNYLFVTFSSYPESKAWGSWGGSNTIDINTYWVKNALDFGGILAHETTHALFDAYVRWSNWNQSHMSLFRIGLSEALAYYTENNLYNYRNQKSKYLTNSVIKGQIVYYEQVNKYIPTFCGIADDYWRYFNASASDAQYNLSWYSLHGLGIFLTHGNTGGTDPKVKALLDNFRWRASPSQLGANDHKTEYAQYEKCFLLSYGKYADFTAMSPHWKSTNYLSGDFYCAWQYTAIQPGAFVWPDRTNSGRVGNENAPAVWVSNMRVETPFGKITYRPVLEVESPIGTLSVEDSKQAKEKGDRWIPKKQSLIERGREGALQASAPLP